MSKDYHKAVRALDVLLADDADMSVTELRAELAAQGVNVDEFLAKFSKTVRKGYQQQIRLAADKAKEQTQFAAATLFGDLRQKTMVELLAIREQVANGVFGVALQKTALARCRNQQGTELSENELRSWLEDISRSASEK
ncbi:MAG: hypothetical protein HZA88_04795 [Verrucomicrobia bacterium]|nr:hypothetical protein [Verrucomicrobiota bacterium]